MTETKRRNKKQNEQISNYDQRHTYSLKKTDDNNINLGNSQIPAQNKAMQVKNLQFNDVKDLISEADIY